MAFNFSQALDEMKKTALDAANARLARALAPKPAPVFVPEPIPAQGITPQNFMIMGHSPLVVLGGLGILGAALFILTKK